MKALKMILRASWMVAFLLMILFSTGCRGPIADFMPIMGARGFYEYGHTPYGHPDPFPGSLSGFSVGSKFSGNGIVYMRKASFFDPDHRAKGARDFYYAYLNIAKKLTAGNKVFSTHKMDIVIHSYPDNWNSLSESERKKIIVDYGIELAKAAGYHSNIPYENGTWYGGGVDYESSYSGEDLYSDMVGVYVGEKALRLDLAGKGGYSRHVTRLTQAFVNKNQYVSKSKAWKIIDSLEGKHFVPSKPTKTLIVRNVDVGEDGYIDNVPIPGFTPARMQMTRLPAPRMDFSDFMGFSADIYQGSNASYSKRCAKKLGVSRVNIKDHPRLMRIIGKEMEAKGMKVFY
mgnify:CR=1 FL=1|jgi:hypothetical protein